MFGVRPAYLVSFNINIYVLTSIKENVYDGGAIQDPIEHLNKFYEICQYCYPDRIT